MYPHTSGVITPTHIAAFNKRINKSSNGCWLWTGAQQGQPPYGSIRAGKRWKAHRFSYAIHYGVPPEHLHVLHRCDTPLCVNPAHLFIGKALENNRDKIAKGRAVYERGSARHCAKLTEAQAAMIKKLLRGPSVNLSAIASTYGVTRQAIYAIRDGRSWAHIDPLP